MQHRASLILKSKKAENCHSVQRTTYSICNNRFHSVFQLLLESVALENVNDTHIDQHTVSLETTLNVPFTVSVIWEGGREREMVAVNLLIEK